MRTAERAIGRYCACVPVCLLVCPRLGLGLRLWLGLRLALRLGLGFVLELELWLGFGRPRTGRGGIGRAV